MNALRMLSLACLLALGGCAVGPDFQRPTAPAKAAYQATPLPAKTDAGQGGAPQALASGMDIPGQWWELFHSPALDALVKRALAHNPDLDAAQQALHGAWENVYMQQGAFWPSVQADFNPTRNKTSAALSPVPANNALYYSLHTAQVSVSYVPDLWGGNRRQVESLKAQAEQQRFQVEATYLTLTSNLVNAAIQEASLRAQLEATGAIVASQRQVLDSTLRQHQLGQLSDSDVAAQRAQLAQAEAGLPALQKQLAQQQDLIAALAGGMPGDQEPAFQLDQLELPGDLPVSLPAQLVEQRPDVRAAEAAWHAACAQVGVAVADRLPNISLSAGLGSAAGSIHQLFSSGMGLWSLAADISQPVFAGGALRHKERAARYAYAQAGAVYRSAVVTAFQNVADTLHAIQADAATLAAADTAERAAARSLQIARSQLALGDVSQVVLLQAEQAEAQARVAKIQAQAARYADSVALFQALGGGWWNRQDVAAVEAR